MIPAIKIDGGRLFVHDEERVIAGRHLNQLAYWGFSFEPSANALVASPVDVHSTLDKVLAYLTQHAIPCAVSEEVTASKAALAQYRTELRQAVEGGARLKDGHISAADTAAFLSFVAANIPRRLKEHQLKAALHLLAVGNGANFSVPGSGKTTVVLAAFSWLKSCDVVDALFVVGPPSCFGPWRDEFEAVLGLKPKVAVLAGGDVQDRHGAYRSGRRDLCDLYLTSFQTLQHDWERVRRLFTEAGARFFFIVDEAHYIKQLGGVWATAVLAVTQHAARRCVLTGTPFPRTYSDAFNLFDVLWPRSSPLSHADRIKIECFGQKQRDVEATQLLTSTIGPLFYRVRKNELHLAPQEFHPPTVAEMGIHEKRIHDAILDRLRVLSKEDYLRDIDLLVRLRRGRMMRLRQTVSYAKLLSSAVLDYQRGPG